MRSLIKIMTILLIVLIAFKVDARDAKPSMKQLEVIQSVSKKYNVKMSHLLKIAYVESRFKQDAVRVNTNGTIDVGMFQINSIHFDTTCKGLDVLKLQGNAECAAKILKSHSKHSSKDAQWIARYHSKTPSLKAKYYQKLNRAPVYGPYVDAPIFNLVALK